MMATASKYDLYPHIKFSTQVKACIWNPSIQKWRVELLNKDTGLEEEELFDIVYVHMIYGFKSFHLLVL